MTNEQNKDVIKLINLLTKNVKQSDLHITFESDYALNIVINAKYNHKIFFMLNKKDNTLSVEFVENNNFNNIKYHNIFYITDQQLLLYIINYRDKLLTSDYIDYINLLIESSSNKELLTETKYHYTSTNDNIMMLPYGRNSTISSKFNSEFETPLFKYSTNDNDKINNLNINNTQKIESHSTIVASNSFKDLINLKSKPNIGINDLYFNLKDYNNQLNYLQFNSDKAKNAKVNINNLTFQSKDQFQKINDNEYIMPYLNIAEVNEIDEKTKKLLKSDLTLRLIITFLIMLVTIVYDIGLLGYFAIGYMGSKSHDKYQLLKKDNIQIDVFNGLTNEQYKQLNQILLNDDGVAFRLYDFIDVNESNENELVLKIDNMTLVDFDDESYQFYNDTCLFNELSHDELDDRIKSIKYIKEEKITIQKEKELKKRIDQQSKLNSKVDQSTIESLPFYQSLDKLKTDLNKELHETTHHINQLHDKNKEIVQQIIDNKNKEVKVDNTNVENLVKYEDIMGNVKINKLKEHEPVLINQINNVDKSSLKIHLDEKE